MNINAINNTNPSFNGKLMTKGQWSKNLRRQFMENETLRNIASNSKYDIIGVMSSKKAGRCDLYHDQGERLYNLTLVAVKEKISVWDSIKNFLGVSQNLRKKNVTHSFHREESMSNIIEERLNDKNLPGIQSSLGIY